MLALGTGSRGCSPPGACEAAVTDALRMGWRNIDCAWEYGTQRLVASGLKASGVPRSEVYVATKLPGPVGAAAARRYMDENLAQLQMAQVDLLLMHYPCGASWPQPRDGCSADEDTGARLETWRAMQAMVAAGQVRQIGVSNFRLEHLRQLVAASADGSGGAAAAAVRVNQVQWHLGHHDDELLAFCRAHNITLQAYSPLGGGGTSTGRDGGISLDDPAVAAIAARHNATTAQVALRWSVQQGVAVVTSTVRAGYLREDLAVLTKPRLTSSELATLSARPCWKPRGPFGHTTNRGSERLVGRGWPKPGAALGLNLPPRVPPGCESDRSERRLV